MVGVDRQAQDVLTDDLIEKEVLPILVAVQNDKSQHPDVRMAALTVLIYSPKADLAIWQQIALGTRRSGSQEYHSYVYSVIKSLAELEHPLNEVHAEMSRKARTVLPLCKPFTEGYLKSQKIVYGTWLRDLQTSFLGNIELFKSKDSLIPNYMFFASQLEYGLGKPTSGFHTQCLKLELITYFSWPGSQADIPFVLDIQGQTIQGLASYLVEQYLQRTSASEAHQELEQIHNILGISQREKEEKSEASIRINFHQQMERLWSFNEESIRTLVEQAKLENLAQLWNGIPFNYQKTVDMMEYSMEMPSVTGIPCYFEFNQPLLISIRGVAKLINQGTKDIQVQADIRKLQLWFTHWLVLIFRVF